MLGSAVMIGEAVKRIITPVAVNYRGMIWLAVIGVTVNFIAARVTHEGDSINQRAVNLHMLEDVLGWTVVLIGSVIMRFTDIGILDALMSIGVAVFIFCGAVKNLLPILELFLEKTPGDMDISRLKQQLSEIEGVEEIHHLHVRSIDGHNHDATLHVVTHAAELPKLKAAIRQELARYHIVHAVIETETERCEDGACCPDFATNFCELQHHGHQDRT